MITTILIIFAIVIAVGMFILGLKVGGDLAIDGIMKIVFKALENSSSLTNAQRMEIVKKMQEIAKKL